jgi:hypothetical protein
VGSFRAGQACLTILGSVARINYFGEVLGRLIGMIIQNLSNLHVATESIREDRRAFWRFTKGRGQRLLPDSHADVKVLMLKSEISCNAAAPVGLDNVGYSQCGQR